MKKERDRRMTKGEGDGGAQSKDELKGRKRR